MENTEVAYRDTWGKGADSFISMLYERLVLMRDLLSESGSIFVHCDWRVNSHLRIILDEIFGKNSFRNEIVWKRSTVKGGKVNSNQMARNHDSILYYTKNDNQIHNRQYLPFSNDYKARFNKDDNDGRGPYRDDQPIGTRSNESLEKMKIEGRVFTDASGKLRIKSYLNDYKGIALDDNWIDISEVNVVSKERAYYPTQKPEALIERIIKLSTDEDDLVADFFVGSGTTAAVAERLGRKWICSDLGRFGVHTTRKRMINIQRELKNKGKDFRAFEILNLGKYERDAFVKVDGDLKKEERMKLEDKKQKDFVNLILQAYKAETTDSFEYFVGKKRDRIVAIGPLTDPVSVQFIYDACHEAKAKGITKIDILGFEFGMGIDKEVLINEDLCKGMDIALKIIPGEVFDKRAIERGHVKFYDLAYVDFKPHVSGRGNEKELKVELTDFAVFYNQDDINAVGEKLKPGSSKVILDSGQVIKLTKAKDSEILEREVLTKEWTDWIDYWSVDFNFASKKEIVRVEENGEEIEKWTGNYIFENEWQSFRTKKDRSLELTSAPVPAFKGEKRKVAVKVIDIFGNDTTKVIEINI